MIRNYFKVAIRRLSRERKYVVTNIVGLTVGITACILIGLFVRHEFSYDTYHEDAGQIYRVLEDRTVNDTSRRYAWSFDGNFAKDIPGEVAEVESAVSLTLSQPFRYLKLGDRQFRGLKLTASQSSLFRVFTHPLRYGSPQGILDLPNTIVLSESTARHIFGPQNPVGQSVTVVRGSGESAEEVSMEVTGVFRDVPSNSHRVFDAVISSATLNPDWSYMLRNYVKLRSGYRPEETEDVLASASEYDYGDQPVEYALQPLTDIYFGEYDAQRQGNPTYVYLFSAIAFLVLVIAVINYMNLATARGRLRALEVGIRKVSGARRSDLVLQFMGEALVYSLLVIPFSLLLVELLLPWFNHLMNLQIQVVLWEHVGLLGMLLLFMIGVGLVAGLYPSMVLSSFQPVEVLKGTFRGTAGGKGFRKALIVTQFVFSCGLIMATLVIVQQMSFIQDKDLGYEEENVIIVRLGNASNRPNSELIKEQFLGNPHVFAAALSSSDLSSLGGPTAEVNPVDRKDTETLMTYSWIGSQFLTMMEIPLVAGHNYREGTADINEGLIINESGVMELGLQEPSDAVGLRVKVNDGSVRSIIGVARNFHTRSLREEISPMALFAKSDNYGYYGTLQLKIRPDDRSETLSSLNSTWESLVSGIPFNYDFLDERIRMLYQQERRTYNLFLSFAGLAIILACLGLFGLAAYASQRRTKEIGIRKVLGASVMRILGLLSKDFSILVMAGFLISILPAWYFMRQWLQQFAYRVEIGVGTILLTGLLTLVISILTVSWQTLRAATANPADSLRTE